VDERGKSGGVRGLTLPLTLDHHLVSRRFPKIRMSDSTQPFFVPAAVSVSLKGKTLVLPVVSTANVAQLAVDLLIHSLGLTRLAFLNDRYLVPAIGSGDNTSAGLTLPLECLYSRHGQSLLVSFLFSVRQGRSRCGRHPAAHTCPKGASTFGLLLVI
jgi:hypothetical protein